MTVFTSHPILGSLFALAAFSYAACLVLMSKVDKIRFGYEDSNGFHFVDPTESMIVPADEVRPLWCNTEMLARLLDHGVQLRRA